MLPLIILLVALDLIHLTFASPIILSNGFPWEGNSRSDSGYYTIFRPAVIFTNSWPVVFTASDRIHMHWTGGSGYYNLFRYSSFGLSGEVIVSPVAVRPYSREETVS